MRGKETKTEGETMTNPYTMTVQQMFDHIRGWSKKKTTREYMKACPGTLWARVLDDNRR